LIKRIGVWVLCGFIVASIWVLYSLVAPRGQNFGHWTVAAITAPASLLGRSAPLKYYSFVLLNAAICGLFGLAAELLRAIPSLVAPRK